MQISEKIKELREIRNESQNKVSLALNIPRYTYANWEQGRSEPSANDLVKLADYYDVTVDYLLGREDDFGNVVSSGQLTDQLKSDEQKLLRAYRAMPDVAKRKIVDDAEFYAYEYQKSK